MSKKVDHLAAIKALPKGKRMPNWFNTAEPELQQEVLRIRTAWQEGELKGHTKSAVHAYCVDKLKLPIKRDGFSKWLDEKTP